MMQTSQSIENISKSIIALNAELSNPKNTADNPFFKSKYAPLNEILNEVRPLLSRHGLAVIQNTMSIEDKIGIQTIIIHSSGENIASDILLLKADKDTAQGQGSAITYGRRYQLSAMLSIASEDDDDGNTASGNKPDPKKAVTPPVLKGEKPKGNQAEFLAKLGKSKTEAHITVALRVRDAHTFTNEEIAEQNKVIAELRKSWEATA
jgi:hypothetical protein